MPSLRNSLLASFVCLAIPLTAHGASLRGFLQNDLRQLAYAIWNYYGVHKTFPSDIVDDHGTRLLSWRVRLLPFVEGDNLYKQFKLDEPWDSPHNRELISLIPRAYTTPFDPEDQIKSGRTVIAGARGPNTFFGEGKSRRKEDIQNPLAIMLVGAEHAPVWTKPEDLPYDPADPAKGLGIRTWDQKFVVLANNKVCTIPNGTDPDLLRAFFSIQEPVRLELFWYEVLDLQPIGNLIKGCFLISLAYIGFGTVVIYRLLSRKPTSPGEMFFLIIGVQQIVFLLAFVLGYRYQVLPPLFERDGDQRQLWAFPGLAAAFAAIVPVFWFWGFRPWRVFFLFPLIWLAILALDSWSEYYDFSSLESLATIGHPIFMALLALGMAVLSRQLPTSEAIGTRAIWHWLGIAAAVLPLIWFSICESQGLVVPRDLFVRIRI
jgi:uncharacterized protein DUF1559